MNGPSSSSSTTTAGHHHGGGGSGGDIDDAAVAGAPQSSQAPPPSTGGSHNGNGNSEEGSSSSPPPGQATGHASGGGGGGGGSSGVNGSSSASGQQQQQQQQEPVNFSNGAAGRRVTLGGVHGSNSVDRRNSLASVGGLMDDLLMTRRPSVGFDTVGIDSLFGRRDSMDSTAALDAAILDLTRRRSSMAFPRGSFGGMGTDLASAPHASTATSSGSGGMGGYHSNNQFPAGFHPSSATSSGSAGYGSSSHASGHQGAYGAAMGMGMGMNLGMGMGGMNQSGSVSSIAARQEHLQRQQRELEQRQKELELQRQQLLGQMQERSYSQGGGPNSGSFVGSHSGSIGYGSFHGGSGSASHSGSMGFGGGSAHHNSLGLGSIHSHGSHGSSMSNPQQAHRPSGSSSGSQQWWICQVCNSKAFASHEEAMTHEATCQGGPRGGGGGKLDGSMHHPMQSFSDSHGRNFSLGGGLDSSTHSAYDGTALLSASSTSMSQGPFAHLTRPMPLAMDADKDWLTPLHCFVRKNCVEIFSASEQDVATPSKGKRKPIQVGQIGIRCPHCHLYDSTNASKARERGSVYYPTTISSIYNATMNLLQRHLHSCPHVPDDIMRRYETLKADDARSGTSKRYWVESALSLGLVDTPNGIRYSALHPPPLPSLTRQQESTGQSAARRNSNEFFSSRSNAVAPDGSEKETEHTEGGEDDNEPEQGSEAAGKGEDSSGPATGSASQSDTGPLVTIDDKPYATAFSYQLLSQMQPCVFTEADRLGKRKGLPPGFPGLACRHCFGGYGSGRFFPSSIKTLSDTSKTLNVLHNHMMRCRKCPTDVREALEKLRGTHDEERAKMKFGSQKAFFARIWERLHGKGKPASLKRSLDTKPPHQGMVMMDHPMHHHHHHGHGGPPPMAHHGHMHPSHGYGPPLTGGAAAMAHHAFDHGMGGGSHHGHHDMGGHPMGGELDHMSGSHHKRQKMM